MNILNLLRAKEPASNDLRREIAGLDLPGRAAAVERLRAKRRQQLLDEVDAATLDRTERELTEAQREHDRAVAQSEELHDRLDVAVRREHLDALLDRKAVVAEQVEVARKALQRRYPDLIDELAAIVTQDRDARQAVRSLNAEMAAAGATETLDEPPAPPVRLVDRLAELVPGGLSGFGV